jgi:aryl-alcohol dehydrogenase-like predicted oxidoreductase
VAKLVAWAEERGHSMVELAHAWLLAQPQVSSVISGATKLSQVQSNAAAGDWALSGEEFAAVNAVLAGE